ncbi:cytochrome c oxidase assembly protein [Allobranchiibius sp. GilTou73]|uniref:cytochrome c oxidase assembly protein n=1 Tax=Allobranchiibius sp. GilTou73 TaxID=2904523 RepID=UPI001F280922|nr:cytochrome c oxidase assembly protein [Allobranchiibius sp. GilTou73]UIJ33418.1 cytochrome c oxidase assembly protein [Allobranchiibius sp. GilTou73]
MPAFTPASWLTAWTWSWPGVVVALLLAAPYLALVALVSRHGERWPWWRTAVYLVAGVGSLIYVTCGAIGAYRTSLLWCFGGQVGVVASVTPLALAIGDPVGLVRRVRPGAVTVLQGRVARVLMFPLLASVLAAVSIVLIFFTGYAQWAITSGIGELVLLAHLLAVGVLVVLPLLTEELLPAWATAPVRALFAFVDGLLDAIPGILVMTASSLLVPNFPGWDTPAHAHFSKTLDQKFTGGALLGVAEAIGVPLLAAVFVQWMRSDAVEAAQVDARLDAEERVEPARTTDAATEQDGVTADRPWWLDDPRLADRFHQRGESGD